MKSFLFKASLSSSILVCLFMFTKLSLNGYKADFYFFIGVLLLNLLCYLLLNRVSETKRRSYINASIAILQILGLVFFLWLEQLQVDKVYQPRNIKYNLYSSLTGWYYRSYFKHHRPELCGDGELWQTKVPYYFPLIEVETERDKCYIRRKDSTYNWFYQHIQE